MSMPGTFQVDVHELSGISQKLDESVSGMRTVTGRMDEATAGQLGHESLDSACADFQSKWKYGIGQVSELANAVRGSIDATAESYRTCEAGIQQAFARGQHSDASTVSSSSSQASVFG